MSRIKLSFEDNIISVEIHSSHNSLEKIREFVKENFEEYYFGRNAIIIYQDYLATDALNEKRQKLVSWFIKNSGLEILNKEAAKEILNSYKKQIKIKIVSGEIYQEITTIKLSMYDTNLMQIEIKKDTINIVQNYIKSRFIYNLIKQDKENGILIVRTDVEGFGETLKALIEKKSIAGKKVFYIYDKSYIDSFVTTRQKSYANNQTDDLRDYMNKIRDSYLVLQLNSQIKDIDIIKKQYYKLAKELHPDNYYSQSYETFKEYEDKFLRVKEAYETLKEYVQKKSA